jgi:predicted 3-demethylubiquinone-9 3-methyltransferase (glyoxalase superfamily)
MDSGMPDNINFNESVSYVVNCESQEEVDYYWNKLSAVPESEQCGWLKDKYGVSWQIVPSILFKLMSDPDTAKAQRVTRAMLKMKKLYIAVLENA